MSAPRKALIGSLVRTPYGDRGKVTGITTEGVARVATHNGQYVDVDQDALVLDQNLQPRVLTGRLSSGAERGHGSLYHAVPDGYAWGTALCGAKPGRHSGSGFVPPQATNQAVTCPRCLRKMAKS